MNNDAFFSIMDLVATTKFRYYDGKVVLYFTYGKVTITRWTGDGTRMQVAVETASNDITCCIGSCFMVTYNRNDCTLNMAGTDINGNEYRYAMFVGDTIQQHEVSLDELLEDDTDN